MWLYWSKNDKHLVPETVKSFWEKKLRISSYPRRVCWVTVIALLHTFSHCRCIHLTGTYRNHFYPTKEWLIPKQSSAEIYSEIFVVATCIGTESNFSKINGEDPTDLDDLWIRSTGAGSFRSANFFCIFCSKSSVSLSTSVLASEYTVHALQQCTF